jgi:peptidoglycan/LPS O-acetylase OafA/YrhL
VHSGSDNSYGVYLAQLFFITLLTWLGWGRLNDVVPWPVVSAVTVVLVFAACVGLTEVLARTPLAKVLTGRTRLSTRTPPTAPGSEPVAASSEPRPSPAAHEPVGALSVT